jgi:hypothetical protein
LWYFIRMNGIALATMVRESPPDSLVVQPYPDGRSVWDYVSAVSASHEVEAADGSIDQLAVVLGRHVFARHPMILDLPPAVLHRYEQAKRIIGSHPGGIDLLKDTVLARFEEAGEAIQNGHTHMVTHSLAFEGQKPSVVHGTLAQRVQLPDSIQHRALAWNGWVQNQIKGDGIDELFSGHPQWHGVKIAEGSLLPVGNLNFELVQGLARARRSGSKGNYAEADWGLRKDGEWGSGLSDWFAMSHIVEKDLLRFARDEIGPDMIDSMQLTPATYAKAYAPVVELIDLNPQLDIQGVLSDGTWAYSNELKRVFPDQHMADLHDIAGTVIELGSADQLGVPEQVLFATADPRRQQAYEAGEYKVSVAARFIDRAGMLAVLKQFGLSASTIA